MVGRDDVPGGPAGAGVVEHVLVSSQIIIPVGAFSDITHREFPIFLRLLDALQETPGLLLFGDVEEKFQNHNAISNQVMLEIIDILKTAPPDMLSPNIWRQSLPF